MNEVTDDKAIDSGHLSNFKFEVKKVKKDKGGGAKDEKGFALTNHPAFSLGESGMTIIVNGASQYFPGTPTATGFTGSTGGWITIGGAQVMASYTFTL